MLKCVLCGAIFPEGVAVCPVCGAGPDQFISMTAVSGAFHMDTDEKFLILGGGIAALSAAEAIRERNATCHITMVTDEPTPPYHRPMLTKALCQNAPPTQVHGEAWYRERSILVVTERAVTALDTRLREAQLGGGIRLRYDKCVYALGARCFIPPIPGADLPEVVAIRTLADAEKVRARIANGARRVVVIGGGVLGLEAAWSLCKAGLTVTVLERDARLMPRQLDAEASKMLLDAARAAGVSVRVGAQTVSIERGADGASVRLSTGENLPADIVIVASGVRANSAIAADAGAATGRAVTVNARMETSLPCVYACGDCAEFGGANVSIWPVAAETGRVAGANAAGDDMRYVPVSSGITFLGMNTSLFAAGDPGIAEGRSYRVEAERDDKAHTLHKRYHAGDALCGVILVGDIRDAKKYTGL